MVTVADFAVRTNSDGEHFVSLNLIGDLEMVQSNESGLFYATARRCSVTSTFTEDQAKALIGKQIDGFIIRQECDEYEYFIPESGETIKLTHRWIYSPEKEVIESKPPKPPVPQLQTKDVDRLEQVLTNGVPEMEEA